jgi:nucleotide-binding universal stress UspA family protein
MIKDLMVHLDGGPQDGVRLAHAEALASFVGGSRLAGLYTSALPEAAYVVGDQYGLADMQAVVELERQLRRDGDRVVANLNQRLAGPGTTFEVGRIDGWPSLIPGLAASRARCADLFMATCPYRKNPASNWDKLVETVLFAGGHGIYLVPPDCPVRSHLRSILLAWKDTAEAARAVSEALPLLALADKVSLLTIDTTAEGDRGEREFALASHLDRHGVKVEIITVKAKDVDVGGIVLDTAAKVAADLVVLGAYGHSRLREWVLGGATRDVIERTFIPLFLAH